MEESGRSDRQGVRSFRNLSCSFRNWFMLGFLCFMYYDLRPKRKLSSKKEQQASHDEYDGRLE